jgi:hypothetical protein
MAATFKKPGSTIPKFKIGQTVNIETLSRQAVISNSSWNGFTWIYSFRNEETCCVEYYLSL